MYTHWIIGYWIVTSSQRKETNNSTSRVLANGCTHDGHNDTKHRSSKWIIETKRCLLFTTRTDITSNHSVLRSESSSIGEVLQTQQISAAKCRPYNKVVGEQRFSSCKTTKVGFNNNSLLWTTADIPVGVPKRCTSEKPHYVPNKTIK